MSYAHFGGLMFKNKGENGKNNLIGEHIARLRRECIPRMSQRALAERLQLEGLDVDKNAIQRIESGQRFITDVELRSFCRIFEVSADLLLGLLPEESI
jgi:transcriptional regulator with XRE-family HTH domain